VLNAAFVDRSHAAQAFYDLFRALSAPTQSGSRQRSQFVEVNLNGKYHGAYLLMERVDRHCWNCVPSTATRRVMPAFTRPRTMGRISAAWARAFEQREPDPLVLPYWGAADFSRFASTRRRRRSTRKWASLAAGPGQHD
jgi:hypothetical protein